MIIRKSSYAWFFFIAVTVSPVLEASYLQTLRKYAMKVHIIKNHYLKEIKDFYNHKDFLPLMLFMFAPPLSYFYFMRHFINPKIIHTCNNLIRTNHTILAFLLMSGVPLCGLPMFLLSPRKFIASYNDTTAALFNFNKPLLHKITYAQLNRLAHYKMGKKLIKTIARDPQYQEQYALYVHDHMNALSPTLALKLTKNTPYEKSVHTAVAQQFIMQSPAFMPFIKIAKKINHKVLHTIKHSWSQSEQHILQRNLSIRHYVLEKYKSYALKHMTNALVSKEKELAQRGYYTFIHGQRRSYLLPELWYTWLWSIKHQKNIDNFIFLHVRPDNHAPDPDYHKIVKTTRSHKYRRHLLFLNYAFFGNITNLGSCSANYIADNNNVHDQGLKLEHAFQYLGYDALYEKYKDELELLALEYKTLSDYGNAILVAIPKNKLEEYAFVAVSGGNKGSVDIDGIGTTRNIRTIMDTLRTNPEKISNTDEIEFCLTMTDQSGLNPDSDIKIFAFPSVEPEKWAAFDTKQKALFAKIKADIEAHRT